MLHTTKVGQGKTCSAGQTGGRAGGPCSIRCRIQAESIFHTDLPSGRWCNTPSAGSCWSSALRAARTGETDRR